MILIQCYIMNTGIRFKAVVMDRTIYTKGQ